MTTKYAHWLTNLACIGLIFTVAAVLMGHFEADSGLSPLASTISAYAASDRMGIVETGILLAGLSSLVLLAGLRACRVPLSQTAVVAFLVWAAGMVVTAMVPTSPDGEPLTTAGYMHRWASTAGFVALMVAGIALNRRLRSHDRWQGLRRPIRLLVAVSAVFGIAVTAVTYFFDRFAIGLLERGMGAAMLGMLLLVSLRLVQLQRAGAPARNRVAGLAVPVAVGA